MEILSDPTGAAHAKYNSDALQVTNAIRLVRLTICLHTLYLSIYPYRCVKGSHETGDSRVLVIPFQLHSSRWHRHMNTCVSTRFEPAGRPRASTKARMCPIMRSGECMKSLCFMRTHFEIFRFTLNAMLTHHRPSLHRSIILASSYYWHLAHRCRAIILAPSHCQEQPVTKKNGRGWHIPTWGLGW